MASFDLSKTLANVDYVNWFIYYLIAIAAQPMTLDDLPLPKYATIKKAIKTF